MTRDTIPSPGDVLRRHGLAAKKSWGQNFLHDPTVHAAIVGQIPPGPRVLEIGPGVGTLTAFILRAGHPVTAIERDRDMCQVLRGEFDDEARLQLHEADAVKFPYGDPEWHGATVVGNLPYQLTGPLLFRLLEDDATLGPWIVMVQREVADRLCAPPGSRTYGAATVSLSRARAITKVRHVPRGAFTPAPRVDSAVLRFDRHPVPRGEVASPRTFPRFVQTIFQRRRKTLVNALTGIAPKVEAMAWCEQLGLDPMIRPERLTVEQFAALARCREAWTARANECL